ncbi:MAG: hypothetical protein ACFFAN_03360 [Promethearchaeota archaeon]
MERLIEKKWVVKLSAMTKVAQIYIERPLREIHEERIQQKEEELKILKSFRFIIGKTLENRWIDVSGDKKDLLDFDRKTYDFKILRITGFEKDCGLIIFEYNKAIKNDIIVKAALQLSCEKLRTTLQIDEEIEKFINPDLKDLKIVKTKIRNYLGAIMKVKFKEGSEKAHNIGNYWIFAANQVVIPIDDKIYIIWG